MADITYKFPTAVINRAKAAVAAKTGEASSNAATKEYFRRVIIQEIDNLEDEVRSASLQGTIQTQAAADNQAALDGAAELENIT